MAVREAIDQLHPLGLLSIVVVGSLLYLVAHSHTSGLGHVPGPLLARYTNLHSWIEAQRHWGNNSCYLRKLHEKYGDIVRVGPRRVSVCDPDAIQEIYGMKASLNKSELIRAAQPLGRGPDNLFSVRDSKLHSQMRRTVANAYSVSTIVQYEPRIDDTLHLLFDIIGRSEVEVNIGKLVHYSRDVYDVQGNMTYGEPLGYLEKGKDAVGLVKQTKMLHRYITLTMPMPILHDIASSMVRLFSAHNYTVFYRHSQEKIKERMREVTSNPLQTKDAETARKSDLLAHFIAAREKYPALMTDDQITTHCMVNVVAGIGTSTTSILNVLKYMIANPVAQDRLYEELREANLTFPVTWRQTQTLPFLEALVREGIRLRAPDGFNPNGRVVGPDGLVLPGGVTLPAGTVVGIKPSVASVQERTFGGKPYEFDPGRWCTREGETEEQHAKRRAMMDRGDMSFSAGTRGCIGKGIALMQIYKLLATLVLKYEILPASPSVVLDSQYDLFCALKTRP